jgi:hypothetical protein
MLVPAGVLVLVVLGAIAVDFAGVFLAQRQLADVTAAAANDAATAALSDQAYYGADGRLAVDPATAAAVVCTAVQAQVDARLRLQAIGIAVGTRWVHVRAVAQVDHVVARAVPGVAHQATVSAAGSAVALASASERVPDNQLVWNNIAC